MHSDIITLKIPLPYGGADDFIYPVLLRDGEGYILVDCGFVGSLPAIEAALEQQDIGPEAISGILLTHHDHDHMGAAAAFREKYPGVKIYASKEEAPYITAEEKPLRLIQAEALQEILPPEQQAFGRSFCALLRQVQPVPVDVLLQDGDTLDWCGGCQVIATPGHTPGHIALYLPRHSTIVAGDAMVIENGRPVIANPQFTLDVPQAEGAIKRLLGMGAEVILCYHSGAYRPQL